MSNKFILSQALGHELEMAIERTGGVISDVHWLRTDRNFENVMLLARGQVKLVRSEISTATIDPIIRIDRSVRPVYPDFLDREYINKPEFIALEKMGPQEFDASRLRKWWHPKQKRGVVDVNTIHALLVKNDILPSCLGYADLLGIQAKGIEFFRRHFKGLEVFGWRTIVPNRIGVLRVPYLVGRDGVVVLDWRWLGNGWGATDPALRFATKDLVT